MTAADDLSPSELCLLALLVEGPRHGWSLAASLGHGGEVGAIWSVARPLVYTGLRRLEDEGYIRNVGLERGERGPHRVMYRATAKGKRTVTKWLERPVEHVRDIRSLFLLKVVLAHRLGLDPEPLLVAQRELMVPFVAWLEARLDDVDPIHEPSESMVLYFRLETAQTTVRFIDHLLESRAASRRRTRRRAG